MFKLISNHHTLPKQKKIFFNLLFILFLILLTNISCAKKDTISDKLKMGYWSAREGNIYTVHLFANSGSWIADLVIEGRYTGIFEKYAIATGSWELNGNILKLTPLEVDEDISWKPNKTETFKILEIDDDNLVLEDSLGYKHKYLHISDNRSGRGKAMIKIQPIAVNLRQKTDGEKKRYFCIDVRLLLENPFANFNIHPKIREAILLYLSSLTYDDVKNSKSIEEIRKKLYHIIKPYVKQNVTDLVLKRSLITTNANKANKFLALTSDLDK